MNEETRVASIVFRLTLTERAEIERAAKADERTVADFARVATINRARHENIAATNGKGKK